MSVGATASTGGSGVGSTGAGVGASKLLKSPVSTALVTLPPESKPPAAPPPPPSTGVGTLIGSGCITGGAMSIVGCSNFGATTSEISGEVNSGGVKSTSGSSVGGTGAIGSVTKSGYNCLYSPTVVSSGSSSIDTTGGCSINLLEVNKPVVSAPGLYTKESPKPKVVKSSVGKAVGVLGEPSSISTSKGKSPVPAPTSNSGISGTVIPAATADSKSTSKGKSPEPAPTSNSGNSGTSIAPTSSLNSAKRSSSSMSSNTPLPRDVPAAVNPAVSGSPPVRPAIAAELSPSAPAVPKVPKSAPDITGSARPPKPPVSAPVRGSPPVAADVKAPVRAGCNAAGAPDVKAPATGPSKAPPTKDKPKALAVSRQSLLRSSVLIS